MMRRGRRPQVAPMSEPCITCNDSGVEFYDGDGDGYAEQNICRGCGGEFAEVAEKVLATEQQS